MSAHDETDLQAQAAALDANDGLDGLTDPLLRQTIRMWASFIETVPSNRTNEAWAIAGALQAIYLRFSDEQFTAGHQAGQSAAILEIERTEQKRWTEEEVAQALVTMDPKTQH